MGNGRIPPPHSANLFPIFLFLMKEKTVALNSIGGKKEDWLFLWRICRMKADRKNREPGSRLASSQARENQELKEVHSVIKSMHLTSVQGARVKL